MHTRIDCGAIAAPTGTDQRVYPLRITGRAATPVVGAPPSVCTARVTDFGTRQIAVIPIVLAVLGHWARVALEPGAAVTIVLRGIECGIIGTAAFYTANFHHAGIDAGVTGFPGHATVVLLIAIGAGPTVITVTGVTVDAICTTAIHAWIGTAVIDVGLTVGA